MSRTDPDGSRQPVFRYSRRVGYVETDQMGVVHHSVYVVYMEEARLAWLRERGLPYRDLEASGILLPVVELHLRYHRPARLEDLLTVEVSVGDVHAYAFVLHYTVRRETTVLARGWTKLACMTPEGRLQPLPSRLQRILGGDAPA